MLGTLATREFEHWESPDGNVLLVRGDCLSVLPTLEAGSVDAIVTDIPYGTTQNQWDVVIPFAPMWERFGRVLTSNGVFVTTSAQPFTSELVMSNREWFRYACVWDRVNKFTDHLNATRRPMRRHEDVLVFSPQPSHTYNPRMVPVKQYKSRRSQPTKTTSYGAVKGCDYGAKISEHNPSSVIPIEGAATTGIVHPTQKPVDLVLYLVETYSNQGDAVADIAMGSGTTGVAAIRTGRKFIGIELEPSAPGRPDYFGIAVKRCKAELERFPLFEPPKPKQKNFDLDSAAT